MICDGLLVCVATDKLRTGTAPELFEHQHLLSRNPDATVSVVPDTCRQQAFVDERGEAGKPSLDQGGALVPNDSDLESGDDREMPNDLVEAAAKELRAPPKEFRAAPDKRKIALGDVPLQIDKAAFFKLGNPPEKLLKKANTTGRGVDMTEKIAYTIL